MLKDRTLKARQIMDAVDAEICGKERFDVVVSVETTR